MAARSVLGALSLLPKGRTLPAGTIWGGNPLRQIGSRGDAGADPAAADGPAAEAPAVEEASRDG